MSESKSWKAWRRQYLSLKDVVADARLPESVRQVAQTELDALEGWTFTLTLTCLLCRKPFEVSEVSAEQMGSWQDSPRGICGPCAGKR